MKPRPIVMWSILCALNTNHLCLQILWSKEKFYLIFKKQFFIISDMAFFFFCEIISICDVITYSMFSFSFFLLPLRDIGTKEKEAWPWTWFNTTLPWVLVITDSGYVIYHDHYKILRKNHKIHVGNQKIDRVVSSLGITQFSLPDSVWESHCIPTSELRCENRVKRYVEETLLPRI